MGVTRWITCLALLGAATLSNAQVPSELDWDQANEATVRLGPSSFPSLPVSVRQDLERRGCTIPQVYAYKNPHNVIHGRFTISTEVDVAVLCSKERVSSILVFRGGSPTNVVELASKPDRHYLQGAGHPNIEFSRMLSVASQKDIRTYYEKHSGPEPLPSSNLEGIEDIFDGKGSGIWYWNDGRWLDLPGTD
jgi:hypothetical protein